MKLLVLADKIEEATLVKAYNRAYVQSKQLIGAVAKDCGYLLNFLNDDFSRKSSGHAVAVAQLGEHVRYFDPNVGRRDWNALDRDAVADAIVGTWLVNHHTQNCLGWSQVHKR